MSMPTPDRGANGEPIVGYSGQSMEYRMLGGSGLEVSVLSFGTMTLGGEGRFAAMGNVQVDEARRFMEICFEAGVNMIDTADAYSGGKSEEVVGQALGARRKDIVLATKCFFRTGPGQNKTGASRGHILEACDASLRRLGTDYIDLYQIHSWDHSTPIEETLEALDSVVRAGKVRYLGVSNTSAWMLAKALFLAREHGWHRFVSVQNHYNLIYREDEREVIPLCVDQGVGLIPWRPLARGFLTSNRDRSGKALRLRAESDPLAEDYRPDDYDMVDAIA